MFVFVRLALERGETYPDEKTSDSSSSADEEQGGGGGGAKHAAAAPGAAAASGKRDALVSKLGEESSLASSIPSVSQAGYGATGSTMGAGQFSTAGTIELRRGAASNGVAPGVAASGYNDMDMVIEAHNNAAAAATGDSDYYQTMASVVPPTNAATSVAGSNLYVDIEQVQVQPSAVAIETAAAGAAAATGDTYTAIPPTQSSATMPQRLLYDTVSRAILSTKKKVLLTIFI